MSTNKLSAEEYDARLCKGYGVDSPKELAETPVFKKALEASKGNFSQALRSLEVKKETRPLVNALFLAAIPDWDYNKKALTGKTLVHVWTEDGDVIEKKQTAVVPDNWEPLKTTVAIGPITKSTYLLRDENDPKRVVIDYKPAVIKAAKHDMQLPDRAEPGILAAIKDASTLKGSRAKFGVIRGKVNDVAVRATIVDDPTLVRYNEGGDYEEGLKVVVQGSDGGMAQINFKADSVFNPDYVAKVFGIEKTEEAFRDALPRQPIFGFGQLGVTMPWQPLEDDSVTSDEVYKYIEAFREKKYLVKDTYNGRTSEKLQLKGKTDKQDENDKEIGKPLESLLFCGREIYDLTVGEGDDGEPVVEAAVLMTSQPGLYPWFSVKPGKAKDDPNDQRPPNNSGGFIVFLEKQLEGVTIERDDSASEAADRWAKLVS